MEKTKLDSLNTGDSGMTRTIYETTGPRSNTNSQTDLVESILYGEIPCIDTGVWKWRGASTR